MSYKPTLPRISHRSASGSHAALSWLGDACQESERWQSPAPWSRRTSQHTVLRLRMRVNEVSPRWYSRLGKRSEGDDGRSLVTGVRCSPKDSANVRRLSSSGTLRGHRRRGCDEHQECEIDPYTVGGAREGRGGEKRGEMIDRWRETGQRCESREYITMLGRGGIQRTEEMRGDGMENGHLLV